MARRTTLTREALLALGSDKLATLVLGEAEQNAPFKRTVTAALAGAKGPEAVAAIVDRRLASLERARGSIGWEKQKAFAADLQAMAAIITDELGKADPGAAAERIVRFLVAAQGVFERVDDSSGHVQAVFEDMAAALPALAERMPKDARAPLFERLVSHLIEDDYGLIEGAARGVVSHVSAEELRRIDGMLAAALRKIGTMEDDAGGWKLRSRQDRLIRTRQAIADQAGDVDAFIALEQQRPAHAQNTLGIAERLLNANRPAEALDWVRRARRPGLRVATRYDLADGLAGEDYSDLRRAQLEILILTALGDRDAAQDLRWRNFASALDPEMLRDYLKHLPDFGEFEALDRAFLHAATHPHRYRALAFLLAWPRLDLAARLVIDHRAHWEGRNYEALVPAAEALEHDHPVAATILYRALIDDILTRARSAAYGHAARHLARLSTLALGEALPAGLQDHQGYRAGLKQAHGRKHAFWTLVGAPA